MGGILMGARSVIVVKHGLPYVARPGFGLIETLIVIAVMAIGALWAVPIIDRSVTRTRVDVGAREWLALLERARNEVLRTGSVVALCAGRRVDAASRVSRHACDDLDLARACTQPGTSSVDPRAARYVDGAWECAEVVAMTPDHRPVAKLQRAAAADGFTVTADATPLLFVPPLGRIAGRPRHFEVGSRMNALSQTGGRHADVYRCVLIAASGRIRMREGACANR